MQWKPNALIWRFFFFFKFFKNLFLGGGRHHLLYSLFWVFFGWKWWARQRVLGKTRALRRLKMAMNSLRKGGGHMLGFGGVRCWQIEVGLEKKSHNALRGFWFLALYLSTPPEQKIWRGFEGAFRRSNVTELLAFELKEPLHDDQPSVIHSN
jgi:hypothetical protein